MVINIATLSHLHIRRSVHWVQFYRAEQECVKWGGHLTSIHSQQELNFIKVHIEILNLPF